MILRTSFALAVICAAFVLKTMQAQGVATGRISGTLAELETLIQAETSGRPVVLDVRNLIMAGQDAVDFLVRCEAADVRLVHCAPYVREWITRQKSGS